MERRNFIKSSLGIGLGATLPGMTHSKSGKEAETAVSPAMPVKSGKPHIILIMTDQQPVSYTHLTLPTTSRV